jgi:GntR family transcriptional regulator
MNIQISEQDQSPIYQQIVNQVKLQVSSGRLRPDEELPSIRALAERLLINPNTVARAYRELEMAGIVTKRRNTGSYISQCVAPIEPVQRLELLAEKVDALLIDAKQLNVSTDEVVGLIYQREELIPQEVSVS